MKRLAAMMACCTLLGGCVTYYPMSETAVKASAAMTEEAALQIVRSQVVSTDKQVGLCAHFMYPPFYQAVGDFTLQPVKMNGPVVDLSYVQPKIADGADDIIRSALARTGTKRNDVERYRYSVSFDMTKLALVKVGEKGSMTTCKGKPGNLHVELINQEPKMTQHRLAFTLAPENLEAFLAAVKRLSPKVYIIH